MFLLFLGIRILNSDSHLDSSKIYLEFLHNNKRIIVVEDPVFKDFLNSHAHRDDGDVPAPTTWNTITYSPQSSAHITVKNCPKIDLLETIIYTHLDSSGRPDKYEYQPICGPHTGNSCNSMGHTLPLKTQRTLADPTIRHFALSGICMTNNAAEPVSFISFVQKTD